MSNSTKRILGLALASAMLLSTFAGCSSSDEGTTSTPTGTDSSASGDATSMADKDTVIIATANETPSVHPYDHNAVAGNYMNQLTYDTLFVTDFELNTVPSLVDTYENVSETEWMFTLKDNIMFHNGEKMTAEDVKASLDWAKTFAVVAQYTKNIGECEVIDELTFKLTTPAPYANLLMDLTHHGNCILPKSLIDSGNNFNENPIGSGPYKFVEWTLGDKLDFVAFEDYFDGAPAIANMTWRVIPEGASRTIALETGEIDAIIEVESNDVARIDENPDLNLYSIASTSHNFMMINNEVTPYNNQDLRLALNYAINRDDIITVALNGRGIPAVTQTPIGLPGTSMENSYTYDVEKAKQYLADSGVDPATVEMPIICSDDTKRRAGEVMQASLLENLGINATIESMDLATYLSATAEGDYIAAIGGYTSSSNLGYVLGVWHSSSINASNKTRMNDAEVDRLIDLAGVTLEADARNATLEELSAYLNSIAGQVPLYQNEMLRASNANLVGFECSPSGVIKYAKLSWK